MDVLNESKPAPSRPVYECADCRQEYFLYSAKEACEQRHLERAQGNVPDY